MGSPASDCLSSSFLLVFLVSVFWRLERLASDLFWLLLNEWLALLSVWSKSVMDGLLDAADGGGGGIDEGIMWRKSSSDCVRFDAVWSKWWKLCCEICQNGGNVVVLTMYWRHCTNQMRWIQAKYASIEFILRRIHAVHVREYWQSDLWLMMVVFRWWLTCDWDKGWIIIARGLWQTSFAGRRSSAHWIVYSC